MSRRARYAVPLVLVLVLVLGWALWPRGANLERFTSQPFTISGRQVRFQLLVPPGWVQGMSIPAEEVATLYLRPKHTPSWLPPRLEELLGLSDQGDKYIIIQAGLAGPADGVATYVPPDQNALCTAQNYLSGKQPGCIFYACRDRRLFRATYRQICESFRVIE